NGSRRSPARRCPQPVWFRLRRVRAALLGTRLLRLEKWPMTRSTATPRACPNAARHAATPPAAEHEYEYEYDLSAVGEGVHRAQEVVGIHRLEQVGAGAQLHGALAGAVLA